MVITLTEDLHNRVKSFAEERTGMSQALYNYRGKSTPEKIIEDIIIGTMGEWGAYEYLKSKGIYTTEPDMQIYEAKRKSYSPDLLTVSPDFIISRIHVKSQSEISAKRYGHSWLLQRSDKIVKSPAFNDYFIFTEVKDRCVEILGTANILSIKDNNLFGECKVPAFRHTKVALYLNDLISGGVDLQCLK